MEFIVIFIAIAIFLFVSAYVTKRRFGLLGLALAAGSLLSEIWGYNAGLVAGIIGIPVTTYSSAIILSIIILLPSVLLLFHGYAYKSPIARIIGASMFTLLALAFLVQPLGHILNVSGSSGDFYNLLTENRNLIIGIGLSLSVVDLFLTKPAHLADKRHRH